MIKLTSTSAPFKGFPNATQAPLTFLGRRYLGVVYPPFNYTEYTHTHNLNKCIRYIVGLYKDTPHTDNSDGYLFVSGPPLGSWVDIMFYIVNRNSFKWGIDGSGNSGTWYLYADLYGDDGDNKWGQTNYTPS